MYKKKKLYLFRELFAIVLLFFKLFIPRQKLKILSIYFHNPPPQLLEKIIIYLNSKNYHIISLSELDEIIDQKQTNERVAFITLDDGWKNNIRLVEVVRKFKIPITIFVTTSAIEQGNFWFEYVGMNKTQNSKSIKKEKIGLFKLNESEFKSEIAKLQSGLNLVRSTLTENEVNELSKEPFITIGSHTVSHRALQYCKPIEQKNELMNSKIHLEKITNQNICYFSYPFGYYSEELKLLAKDCGYMLCFSTDTHHIELNNIDKLSIPRRCVNDDAGYYEALSKIFGIWYKIRK